MFMGDIPRYPAAPCPACPMRMARKVGARGNPAAALVIIGEAPGTEELKSGISFCGPSGELLQKCLPVDFDIDTHAYVLNAMQCRPPKTNDQLKDKEFKSRATSICRARLLEQIWSHPRKCILALGSWATVALTANHSYKITQSRGEPYRILSPTGDSVVVIPAVHPAYLLRGSGNSNTFRDDLSLALSVAYEGRTLHIRNKEWKNPQNAVLEEFHHLQWYSEYLHSQLPASNDVLYIASDIETSDLHPLKGRILSIGFYTPDSNEDVGYIIPQRAWLSDRRFRELLRRILAYDKFRFIWQFGRFDEKFLRMADLVDKGTKILSEDTGLMSYALSEATKDHDLDEQAKNCLGAPNHKHEIKTWVKKKADSYELIPEPNLFDYQAKDLKKTYLLWEHNRPKIAADTALEKLYTRTLLPHSNLLTDIELRGIHVDWDYVRINRSGATDEDVERLLIPSRATLDDVLSGKAKVEGSEIGLENELIYYEEQLTKTAGYRINPNSPGEVSDLLYDRLGLKIKNKRPEDTRKETLDKLPPHPCVKLIRRYRSVTKMLSTYVGAIEKLAINDRIHTSFKQHVTPTGRLASTEPNIQNIPRDPRFRRMYRARPGYVLIEGDYNTAELRMLAALSGDIFLTEIFLDGERSLHDEVAISMYGSEFSSDQRIRAKAVNFGIPYGREAFSVAEEFDISTREAQRLIDSWFARMPEAAAFLRRSSQAAFQGKTLVTVFGRKRRPGVVSRERLHGLSNEFRNFHMQSPISDFTLHSGCAINPQIEQHNAWIVNLVHDSTLIECPDDFETICAVGKIVQDTMEEIPRKWIDSFISFNADLKVGTHWGLAEKYDKWLARQLRKHNPEGIVA